LSYNIVLKILNLKARKGLCNLPMKPNLSSSVKSKSLRAANYFSITVLTFILLISAGEASIYSYTDENGKTHYTNDLFEIPLEYREGDKKIRKLKDALKPPHSSPVAAPTPPAAVEIPGLTANTNEIHIPLIPKGNNYYIDVLLNDKVTARLLLDTGASLIDLSKEVAEELGYYSDSIVAKMPFTTANGRKWSPVIGLKKVRIGNAQSILVEASINDTYINSDGLLRMSFLGDFRFEIDRSKKLLILKPLTTGEMEWGGKTGSWWKKRFNRYNESIRRYSRTSKQMQRNREQGANFVMNLSKYYEGLKKDLETQAMLSGVPEKYR
jgi:clan AA aspartic protease (TIGR02281 family)